jgi:N utilization substance protein B
MSRGRSAYHRRESRSLALQALYEADVTDHAPEAFRWLIEEGDVSESSLAYALELLEGVVQERRDMDELIQQYAPAWPVRQLPVVDRNILRMALFEIGHQPEVPHKVAINEAVELAKTFGSDSSARFVNGVLGSVMDAMDQDTVGAAAQEQPGR